VSNVLMDF